MEKLELKHLAGYLPYQLRFKLLDYKCDYIGEEYGICNGYYMIGDGIYYTFKDRNTAGKNFNNCNPILRPLSDLTKPITIDGITFVPNAWIYDNIKKDVEIYKFLNGKISLDIETENYNQTIDLMDGYLIIQKLNEWHFDWQGLIDKGLAIDINTLK